MAGGKAVTTLTAKYWVFPLTADRPERRRVLVRIERSLHETGINSCLLIDSRRDLNEGAEDGLR